MTRWRQCELTVRTLKTFAAESENTLELGDLAERPSDGGVPA
jgi:hypothetical protein